MKVETLKCPNCGASIRAGAEQCIYCDAAIVKVSPESAVAEDVHSVVSLELVAGSSLWRDAWRRLLKNKLAVFGMVVVLVIALASLIGPAVIQKVTGNSYETIPRESRLNKSFPPFRSPEGQF